YAITATALGTGATDTITSGEWATPQIMAAAGQDGADGADGADGVGTNIIWARSSSAPATPSPSAGTPAGWYDDVGSVPAGNGIVWASFGTRPDSGSPWTWQAAFPRRGQDGHG